MTYTLANSLYADMLAMSAWASSRIILPVLSLGSE
jgi:hypothetical protein